MNLHPPAIRFIRLRGGGAVAHAPAFHLQGPSTDMHPTAVRLTRRGGTACNSDAVQHRSPACLHRDAPAILRLAVADAPSLKQHSTRALNDQRPPFATWHAATYQLHPDQHEPTLGDFNQTRPPLAVQHTALRCGQQRRVAACQ